MRRELIALAASAAIAGACASASPPPGGPEDHAPPLLVKVTPDSGAVNVHGENATFYFDETINDRGTGAAEIDAHFLVSPSDGLPRVNWHRSRIDVRPRNGFRDNTAYSITLLPGLGDLRGNAMKAGHTIIFSTGPTIPPHQIAGTVFDWAAERPAPRAFVEAITPDSVRYLAQADSLGRFVVGPLPAGPYLVRGIVDANSNRSLDRNEAYDSAAVVAPQTGTLELLAIARDTLAVRIQTVTVVDSLTLRVAFDRPLSPKSNVIPANLRLVGPDSLEVPIVAVLTPAQEAAELKARQQAVADSTHRADSLAGKTPAPTPPVAPPLPTRGRGAAPVPPPKPSIPAPISTLLVKLGKPLAPVTVYRLHATGVYGLSGRTAPSERSFSTPKPPPPPKAAADSTRRAPADTTRRVAPPTAPTARP